MGLVRASTNLLVLWITLHATRAQKVDTGTDNHGPQVQIHMKVEKKNISPLDINPHLKETVKTDSRSEKKLSPTEYLSTQSVSSVLFNEIDSLVLTKSSFRLISYFSFKPHYTAFSQIEELLERTLDKAESYLHIKSFPPYHRTLKGEPKFIQNLKDDSIRVQLTELTYEINVINKNFESVKTRFSQITGTIPTPGRDNSTGKIQYARNKRSVASSIFKFLFGGGDNSETIRMLKENIATLMANDQLQESRLKEILKSQQLNAADIKINRNLIRQMTKELAQVNVTLTEITYHTEILFTLASFQVTISQLRHLINIIRDSLFGLQMNLDILYHHFSAMVNNKLTPEMIPPAQLLEILQEVKEDIRDHPKLSLHFLILFSTQYKTMGLVRASTNLVLWITLHATRAQKVDTGTDNHGPQVQIHMKVEKKNISPLDINPHLKETVKTDSRSEKKLSPTEYLSTQSVSSVLFNEIDSLVLTKSSFRLISYFSFKPHYTAFSQIEELLERTLDKAESYLHIKSFPPYHRTLKGEPKFIQNLKDDSIRVQLTELTYEINVINKNFESVKTRFSQITGTIPTPGRDNSTGKIQYARNKRSVASSIFKFLFGGGDNSETIRMLKENIATLMANDQLQESRLKEILKSQQLNAADIKINRNLIRQMTKELAQVNVTLTEITYHTEILFTLASFQVTISQLRHLINIIRDSLFGLQMNLDILYHHFSAMVNNKLTPEMIPPAQLLEILQEVKEDIRDHPKLSLPEELTDTLIYKYYKIIKF